MGCYCGFDSDYNQVLARSAFVHESDTPCAGDSNLACGRGDRVQIYTRSPPPTPALPGGWGVASACSVDNASRVLEGHRLFSLPVNSPAFCASWCEHTTYSENGVDRKYNWAGVENGDECICGKGWKNGIGPPSAPTYDCATPCPENPTDPNGCGGSWRIRVFGYEWNWGDLNMRYTMERRAAVGAVAWVLVPFSFECLRSKVSITVELAYMYTCLNVYPPKCM